MQFFDDLVLPFTLRWEGGSRYTNDPDDPGGETRWGISKRRFPGLDIKRLTYAVAHDIYVEQYWEAPGFSDVCLGTAWALFDYGVNSGPPRAVRGLQHSLNADGRNLAVDGDLGPATQDAILRFTHPGGAFEPSMDLALARRLLLARTDFLCGLAVKNPTRIKYIKGWMRRVVALSVDIGDML